MNTNLSRRAILKAAGALPVAAAAAPLVNAPAFAYAHGVAIAAPVDKHPWQWWCSHNKEIYFDPCATREEALAIAKSDGYSIIAECRHQDYSLELEPSRILEMLQDDNLELIGDGEFFNATPEQEKDLGEMLTATMYAWAEKHKIDITAWQFGDIRNSEELVVADEEADEPSTTDGSAV